MIKFVVIGNSAFDVNTFLNRGNITVVNNGGACLYSLIPASIYTKTGVVTRIGNDFNKGLFEDLNIDKKGLKFINSKSSKFIHTYTSSNGQERTFKAEINDDCMITIDDIPNEYLSAKYIHISTNFPDTQLEMVKYLKQNSKAIISIDTHEAYYKDEKVLEAFNLADIAFIDKEFTNLYNCNAKIKILKLGSKGCKFISENKEFTSPATLCEEVIDKTGAGDVVAGVFMALLSMNYSYEYSLNKAVNMATESIKDYGVEHLLKNKFNIGFTIGKFAPFHKGHEYLIEEALKVVDKLYVIVYDTKDYDIKLKEKWIKNRFKEIEIIEAFDSPKQYGLDEESINIQMNYLSNLIKDVKMNYFFSSEDYGKYVAKYLNIKNIIIDKERIRFPIGSSSIKNDIEKYKDFISDEVYNDIKNLY